VFVVDAYTRRLFRRLGLTPPKDGYDAWQSLFTSGLPPDAAMFNEYHALIVRHGKEVCRREPLCERCALLDICVTGRARTGGTPATNAPGRASVQAR
jgi:endonuclease-3 related protein